MVKRMMCNISLRKTLALAFTGKDLCKSASIDPRKINAFMLHNWEMLYHLKCLPKIRALILT
jgi:hypothetical protein